MMEKLSFEYDSREHESIAYVGDSYRVRMVQDDLPENPFTAWEGHWPMIVRYDRHETEYGDIPCPFDSMTDGQLIKRQNVIESALGDYVSNGWHSWSFEQEKAEWLESNRASYANKGAALRDFYSDALGNVSDADKMETMAALFGIAGIPALCTSSSGYSQGDYAELLIVGTKEAMDSFGWNKKQRRDSARIAKDMEGQAALYGFWAWGDVYGYVCERATAWDDESYCTRTGKVTREPSEWEELEDIGSSVWGFYGNDPDESGLAEQALDAIEWDMSKRRKARWGKLSELIKARVPLAIRASIITAPEYALASAL